MPTSVWSDGYVADIPYLPGFYPDQAPAHLNFACLLKGFEPRSSERPFTYCELGCGQGLTAALLAAANRQGRFYAADFNPAHIAAGRELAAAAELSNVEFIESGFDDLNGAAGRDLPEFDFIALHGIYSWVSPENQRAIVAFIRRRLTAGGIVYISYNSMPRWTDGLPLQRMLYEFASLIPGRTDHRFEQALSFAKQLREARAYGLENNAFLNSIMKNWEAGRIAYLSHEYLNAHWQALYHADVARHLVEAKLDFVASSVIFDNFPDLTLTPAQRELLSKVEAPEFRETLKDFFLPRVLRRDIFVRGARRLTNDRREELLRRQRLALVIPRMRAALTMNVPLGQASVEPRVYEPILDALAQRPHTIGELLELSPVQANANLHAPEIAGMLVGSRQALPARASGDDGSSESAKRFNRVVARRALTDALDKVQALAVGLLGTGLHVTGIESRLYDALDTPVGVDVDEIASVVWQFLAARGETLVNEGKALKDKAECLTFVRDQAQRVIDESVPLWHKLGMI